MRSILARMQIFTFENPTVRCENIFTGINWVDLKTTSIKPRFLFKLNRSNLAPRIDALAYLFCFSNLISDSCVWNVMYMYSRIPWPFLIYRTWEGYIEVPLYIFNIFKNLNVWIYQFIFKYRHSHEFSVLMWKYKLQMRNRDACRSWVEGSTLDIFG